MVPITKVYEGIYFLMIRNLRGTAELFLDSIATFNAPEIISFPDLVFYTVLTNAINMPRTLIK